MASTKVRVRVSVRLMANAWVSVSVRVIMSV